MLFQEIIDITCPDRNALEREKTMTIYRKRWSQQELAIASRLGEKRVCPPD